MLETAQSVGFTSVNWDAEVTWSIPGATGIELADASSRGAVWDTDRTCSMPIDGVAGIRSLVLTGFAVFTSGSATIAPDPSKVIQGIAPTNTNFRQIFVLTMSPRTKM